MDEATRQLLSELAPDENLGQCISRHAKDTITLGVPLLDLAPTFNKTDVIELCGQTGTGKSELLYSIAIAHILPKQSSKGLNLGGRGQHVVYLDLDHKFDIFRMSNLLQCRIETLLRHDDTQNPDYTKNEDILQILTGAFEKLHVFSCKSSVQVAATLKVLATTFVPQLYHEGESLGLVIVDNICAYWDMLRELRQGGQASRGQQNQMTFFLEAIMKNLSEIQNLCEIPIVISRRLRGTGESSIQEPDTNRLWKDFTTKSVHLEKLGKPSVAKHQTNIGYRLRWVKPDIRQAITYQIQSSSGIGIQGGGHHI